MTVTTEEAAESAGVSVQTIRRWVARGELSPVRPDAKVWRFHYEDVAETQLRLRSAAWRARHAQAAEAWQASVSSM